jgi:hypothetical protein
MKRSGTGSWSWGVLVLGLAAALWFGGWNGHADAEAKDTDTGSERVLALASSQLKDGYTVSLQWYGQVKQDVAAELKTELGAIIGLEKIGAASADQESYRLVTEELEGSLTFVQAGHGQHVQVVVSLEGTPVQASGMITLQSKLADSLSGWDKEGLWTTKAQGVWSLPGEDASRQGKLSGAVEDTLKGQVSSIYKDRGIVSMTFRSELLPVKASKEDATALQTAYQQDTETGEWKLSIGAPMLTGEF